MAREVWQDFANSAICYCTDNEIFCLDQLISACEAVFQLPCAYLVMGIRIWYVTRGSQPDKYFVGSLAAHIGISVDSNKVIKFFASQLYAMMRHKGTYQTACGPDLCRDFLPDDEFVYHIEKGVKVGLGKTVRRQTSISGRDTPAQVVMTSSTGRWKSESRKFVPDVVSAAVLKARFGIDLNTRRPCSLSEGELRIIITVTVVVVGIHEGSVRKLLSKPLIGKASDRIRRPYNGICENEGCVQKCTYKCSKCLLAWYCSSECQKIDWKKHCKECDGQVQLKKRMESILIEKLKYEDGMRVLVETLW